jgi:hypothetical protein
MLGKPEERPGALAEALDQARLDQQLEVARYPRLRLAQDVGEDGDAELRHGKQGQHAQARHLAGRIQRRVEGLKTELAAATHGVPMGHFPLYKDIFMRLMARKQGHLRASRWDRPAWFIRVAQGEKAAQGDKMR